MLIQQKCNSTPHRSSHACQVEYGDDRIILGIRVRVKTNHIKFNVCPKKSEKWSAQIKEALKADHMDAGQASKTAGRFNFATQRLFRKFGRAMIRPVYAQTSSKTGRIGKRLRVALIWWLQVLELNTTEECPFVAEHEKDLCRLYVDAASTPAHCAAVFFLDGKIMYTNAAPEDKTMKQLAWRNDKQITSLVKLSSRGLHVNTRVHNHIIQGDLEHISRADYLPQRTCKTQSGIIF